MSNKKIETTTLRQEDVYTGDTPQEEECIVETIDFSVNKAIEDGTMVGVDLLGNETPYVHNHVLDEIIDGKEKDLPVHRVLECVRDLQGKILTVIDATMVDKDRAKYVKDIIREAFSTKANWIYEMSIRDLEGL